MLKHRSVWSVALGAIMLSVMVLSGCGPTGGSSSTTGGQPKYGGTVTDALYEQPDNLIVGQSVETFAQLVMNTIWAPLVYIDSAGSLQPGDLAQLGRSAGAARPSPCACPTRGWRAARATGAGLPNPVGDWGRDSPGGEHWS